MFETLQMAPPDAILGLTEAFKKDPHPQKINLSVGVYQDASGKTPIMNVVREAEKRMVAEETTKSYLAIDGLPEYGRFVRELLLGPGHEIVTSQRAVTAQTPGGTGALRVAADFLQQKVGAKRIWCSKPTWANHPNVFQAAGLQVETYPYIDAAGTGLDFDAMMSALANIPTGDAVCLHACCHNPTGIDPTVEQWKQIGATLQQRGVLPLVDFAYQGLAQGLEDDAQGLKALLQVAPKRWSAVRSPRTSASIANVSAPDAGGRLGGISPERAQPRQDLHPDQLQQSPTAWRGYRGKRAGRCQPAGRMDSGSGPDARANCRNAAAVCRHSAQQRCGSRFLVYHAATRHVFFLGNIA